MPRREPIAKPGIARIESGHETDPEVLAALQRFPIGRKFKILTRIYLVTKIEKEAGKIIVTLKHDKGPTEQHFLYPLIPSGWEEIME